MNVAEENPAALNRSISYDLTRGDLFIGFITTILRNRLLQIMILTFLVTSEIAVVVFEIGAGLFSSTIVLCIFYAALFCAIMLISQAALGLVMAYQEKEHGVVGRHTLEITEQGLREGTEFNETLHKWPAIHRIASQFGYLYIYVSYGVYHQVPTRRIPRQEFLEFEAELRARTQTHDRV